MGEKGSFYYLLQEAVVRGQKHNLYQLGNRAIRTTMSESVETRAVTKTVKEIARAKRQKRRRQVNIIQCDRTAAGS